MYYSGINGFLLSKVKLQRITLFEYFKIAAVRDKHLKIENLNNIIGYLDYVNFSFEEKFVQRIIKKALYRIVLITFLFIITIFIAFRFALVIGKNKDRIIQKYKKYYMLLLKWLEILESEQSIGDYLEKKGFYSIAVYGGKDTGYHFIKQLEKTNIIVNYIIDKNSFGKQINGLPIYQLNTDLPKVDAIVVTPIWDYQNIKHQIENHINCPVVSLEDVIVGAKGE